MPRPMKDSGVKWLGEIPAHWNCCKLKYLISSLNSGTSITTTDLTDEGYPVYGGGQQIGFFPQFNMEDTLIIGRVGSCGCVTKISGKAWATDNALIVTTDFPKDYLYYILVAAELNKLSTSNAQPLITSGKVLNHKVAVPPLDEQQRIATFLDGECARIDSVIEKTRASIVEYKKLKQAIITRAVTNGIRPARTMKDSGVEWLGEIPADWDAVKIKYLFTIKKQIAGKEGYTVLSITQKGITPKDLFNNEGQLAENYSHYQIVNIGDFAMNHMDLLTGWIDISKYCGVTSPDYRVFVLNDRTKCSDRYYLYLMQMCYSNRIFYRLGQGVSGMGRWRLQADKFLNFFVTVPPMEEQKEIAQYLDEKTAAIDLLVEKKNQLVTELERLKKSLIFEYVTGKKELTGGDLV